MIRHATRRAAASMVITALLILTLTGCHELNNIVDPDAADYQGYYTVETPSDVGPDSPSDGETLYFQAFFASRVYDRTDLGPYHFTVSTSSDLTYTSGYLLDNDTVATNMFSTSLDLIVGTAYYWGVEVYDPGTTEWTGRGGSLSFIPGSIDISSVSPGDAESVDTNYPLIEWGPIEGATGYQLRIANSYSGVTTAAVKTLVDPSYEVTSADGFLAGDTIYWKARPMKAVDGLGTVLGFWGSVCSFYTPILYEGFEDTFTGSLPDGWYTTDGWYDYGWSVTSETSKTGDKCLVSDDIGNSDEATVYLEVYCSKPSTVSFYKKVSSEAGYDELEFYIDNEKMDEWSGLLSLWTRVSYDLDTGSHELKWIYDKDSSTSSGSDRAWIDEVVVK